ncbi:hypothetical protein [Sporosarcina jiandibaonis]|uniref:hypothetical protein n=1 Tax=Sporosarcina jiandibaonis TaxID=2715535 RepID=UPI0015532402|nr:hypothetical protein [Sporosarcina jiandibaonis]
MKRVKYILFLLLLFNAIVLTACSEKEAYEIKKFDSKVSESENEIQLELAFEIVNNSKEDYYFTFGFPSYIQDALISKVGTEKLPASSYHSGVAIIAVSKNGGEMTEGTIEAILNGEIPFVEHILIGKAISLE